jgi:hypothetical protein
MFRSVRPPSGVVVYNYKPQVKYILKHFICDSIVLFDKTAAFEGNIRILY